MNKKGIHLFWVLSLFIFFALSMTEMVFQFDKTQGLAENRKMKVFPDLPHRKSELRKFVTEFDTYFSDCFGYRKLLIRSYSYLKYFGFGQSPSKDVMIGKNQHLFYKGDSNLETYQHRKSVSESDLEIWKKELIRRKEFLEKHKIDFVFIVAPDAHSIETGDLPSWVKKFKPGTVADEILTYVQPEIRTLNLKNKFHEFQEKMESPLYFQTDTHWTPLGAMWASTFLLNFLQDNLSYHFQHELPFKSFRQQNAPGGDLSLMMGLQDYFSDKTVLFDGVDLPFDHGADRLEFQSTKVGAQKKLLMFRDSFGASMIPFLQPHFQQSLFLKTHAFNEEEILKMKPDLVVLEMVERILSRPPNVALLMK